MRGNPIGTSLNMVALTGAILTLLPALSVADAREVQLKRLFAPHPAELRAEARGQVYIYHGLTDSDVHRAMDQQFDRVGRMMFVHTLVTDKQDTSADDSGAQGQYEDDGCD